MVKLRSATYDDLALLVHWSEQPHVIEAVGNGDWQWETELTRNPDWRETYIAEHEGEPIGFLEIIDPAGDEGRYWKDVGDNLRAIDIWIGERENLGKGYGTGMMKLALARCFSDRSVEAVLVDPLESNQGAHRFYERLGFEKVGKRRLGDDESIVYSFSRERYLSLKNDLADDDAGEMNNNL